jgi:type IV secretory pathway VirD2 relaxase
MWLMALRFCEATRVVMPSLHSETSDKSTHREPSVFERWRCGIAELTGIISASSFLRRMPPSSAISAPSRVRLMTNVARDLGTKLDWIAADHWNTDNPHVHVLIRGRAEDGQDLVISRDYISRGFRDRAAERVTLELGPRSEREIRSALVREVEAERWTSLDRALRIAADEGAGVADLRPGASGEDPELRRLMVGRAARLERLGLAEQIAPGCWTLKPGIEDKLRDLSIRNDIIKTMHRAMGGVDREPDVSGFALHGDAPVDAVLGRLVERGLHDELKGSAYAIVEGIDGRTHHRNDRRCRAPRNRGGADI